MAPHAAKRPRRRALWIGLPLLALLAVAADHAAARRQAVLPNPPYTGDFTFTRIRYGERGGGFRGRGGSWAHDYPAGDLNMARMVDELTAMRANTGGTNVFDLDDPELFRNPIAYISEPGFWDMTDAQAEALRRYVDKGGFLIFDDFELEQWRNFEAQLRRALPDAEFVEIGPSHLIFNTFITIQDIYFPHPLVPVTPSYFAVFENDDPDRRIVAIVNYNNDLAEFWEWSESGVFPVDDTTESYKLGLNYIFYGMIF